MVTQCPTRSDDTGLETIVNEAVRPTDLDRCAGVLLGLAAGDALGAGYEFASPPKGDAAMNGGGLGNWDPGEWTANTQVALCISEEAATGTRAPTAFSARFLAWYRSGPADVGIPDQCSVVRGGHGQRRASPSR